MFLTAINQYGRLIVRVASVIVAVIGLVFLLLVLAGFFHHKIPAEYPGKGGQDLSKHQFAQVSVIRTPRYETAVGTIKAVHEAAVASRLLARIVEVKVTAGQAVQANDVLVRLDDADLQARFKQAEAGLVAAKTNYEHAQMEYKRAVGLMQNRAIAQADFDQAVAKARTTEADLRRNEQAVDEAKAMLAYATLRAPLTGIVIDKRVEVGDTAIPGQTLVTLFNPGKMQMLVSVRESLALKLKVGQKVPGRIESLDRECEGTISEIVPEAQAASRSFIVKVVGPCPPGVYSGMFGRIFIPLEDEEITVIPAVAVKRVGQLEMVRIVEDGSLRRRNIQTGRTLGSNIEVLSGLRAGERVVVPATGTEDRP